MDSARGYGERPARRPPWHVANHARNRIRSPPPSPDAPRRCRSWTLPSVCVIPATRLTANDLRNSNYPGMASREIYAVFEVGEDPGFAGREWNGAVLMDVLEEFEARMRHRPALPLSVASPYPRVLSLRSCSKQSLELTEGRSGLATANVERVDIIDVFQTARHQYPLRSVPSRGVRTQIQERRRGAAGEIVGRRNQGALQAKPRSRPRVLRDAQEDAERLSQPPLQRRKSSRN